MGDYIEVQWLAGVPYLVWCSDKTRWKDEVIKLEFGQVHEIEEFQAKQDRERKEFMFKKLEQFKGDN